MGRQDQCGKRAPAGWEPSGQSCILPKNHPVVKHKNNAGEELIVAAHVSEYGRTWPTGDKNLEYL